MSAGTGIEHSEMNANKDKPVTLLQIWMIPNKMGVTPRYEQKRIDENQQVNEFQQIVSRSETEDGVWIHQDAWFNMANFEKDNSRNYNLHLDGNGVYVFVISGKAKIGDQVLEPRDGFGISETDSFQLEALEDSQILLMEVPMELPD